MVWSVASLTKIIPVVVLENTNDAEPLALALVAGGLPVAEVTFRTAAAAESIRIMSQIDGIVVGAGTVVSPAQVETAAAAGAQFIVSPGLSAEVVAAAREHSLPVLPGAVTPTEVIKAIDLGLEAVKFFPAGQYGGAKTIKALSAPFPTMEFIPTGGVSLENMPDYLRLPCTPAVGGSWMVSKALVASHDFARITELSRSAVSAAAALTDC